MDLSSVWIQLITPASCVWPFFFFFFFLFFVCMCVCVEKHVLWLSSGSRALFMGPTNLFFLTKFLLKMGLTSLFTYLKIILLQCFQFSVK